MSKYFIICKVNKKNLIALSMNKKEKLSALKAMILHKYLRKIQFTQPDYHKERPNYQIHP